MSSNMAQDYGNGLARTLSAIWHAVDAEQEYEGQEPLEYLEEMPLEIVRRVGAPFQVVLTVGGPDSRIEAGLDDAGDVWGGAHLVTHWGSDVDRQTSGPIRRTAEHFNAFYEG